MAQELSGASGDRARAATQVPRGRALAPRPAAPSARDDELLLPRGLVDAGEKILPLATPHDDRRKIDALNPPPALHPEPRVPDPLDLGDAVLPEPRRRPADRAEVEAAVLLA